MARGMPATAVDTPAWLRLVPLPVNRPVRPVTDSRLQRSCAKASVTWPARLAAPHAGLRPAHWETRSDSVWEVARY